MRIILKLNVKTLGGRLVFFSLRIESSLRFPVVRLHYLPVVMLLVRHFIGFRMIRPCLITACFVIGKQILSTSASPVKRKISRNWVREKEGVDQFVVRYNMMLNVPRKEKSS